MNGSYSLFLDDKLIEEGKHVFEKFWLPTNLTFNLGKLNIGTYKLRLALMDEGEHVTTDEVIIFVDYHESTSTITINTNSFLLGLIILIVWRKRAAKK